MYPKETEDETHMLDNLVHDRSTKLRQEKQRLVSSNATGLYAHLLTSLGTQGSAISPGRVSLDKPYL